MLKVSQLDKRFGSQRVLSGVSFVVNAGGFAGVVGPNGSGKTTLLRIIAGQERADGGHAGVSAGARIGYLRQGYALDAARPVRDVFPRAFPAQTIERAERIAVAMAEERDRSRAAALADDYAAALADAQSGADGSVAELFEDLGLRAIDGSELTGRLSGGEQTKLGLIDLCAARPDVLLLDEPTNNLDLDALAWLDAYLAGARGAVLAVSHDRALLDGHADTILEIDPATGGMQAYAGDYTAYAAEKQRRADAAWQAYRRQQERERRVRREISDIKSTASRHEGISENDFYRRKAKKIARRAVVLERRLERELEGEARVDKPRRQSYRLKLNLHGVTRSGDRMLQVEGLAVDAGGTRLLTGVDLSIGWGERLVLTGPNGSGKTSLLRILADRRSGGDASPSQGGVQLSPSARIGYLAQQEDTRDGSESSTMTPLEMMRRAAPLSETEARRFLHRFLFSGDDALRPVSLLSYGERRRLALARIVIEGSNLLLLDEPTNHLDLPSREAFEAALDSYDGAMLAVTHDRYFIERFAQRLLAVEGGALREYRTTGGAATLT